MARGGLAGNRRSEDASGRGAVSGELSAGGGKFYWMVRYLGHLPIIYAVDAKPLPPKPKPGATPAEPQPEPQAAPAEQGQRGIVALRSIIRLSPATTMRTARLHDCTTD